jgi:hypothetical protein
MCTRQCITVSIIAHITWFLLPPSFHNNILPVKIKHKQRAVINGRLKTFLCWSSDQCSWLILLKDDFIVYLFIVFFSNHKVWPYKTVGGDSDLITPKCTYCELTFPLASVSLSIHQKPISPSSEHTVSPEIFLKHSHQPDLLPTVVIFYCICFI